MVSEEKPFEAFFPEWVCEKQVTPGAGPFFDPRAMIWTILVEVHKMKLHTKYQKHWPSSFRQEGF